MKRKLAIAVALALPILVALAHAAWIDPRIEFLRPARGGSWIVHPDPLIWGLLERDFRSADVRFTRSFMLETVPAAFELRLSALDRAALQVNGEAVTLPPVWSWKHSQQVDVARFLHRGTNRLDVLVSYAQGPPALLVVGRGAAAVASSDRRWEASHPERSADAVPAARALRDEAFLKGRPNLFASGLLLAVVIGFAGYALLPLRFKPWLRLPDPAPELGSLWRFTWIAVFTVVAAIQLFRAATLDSGMADGPSHLAYVRYVAKAWRVPLAEEGWQMYHPPLYYVVAAALGGGSSVVFLRVLNTLFGLANVILSGLLLCRLLPHSATARTLAFVLVATLPMTLTMNPQVTNEVLAGSLVSCTFLAASVWLFHGAFDRKRAALLGLLCGLALLAKFSGLFVVVSILALLVLRWASTRHSEIAKRAVLLVAVAAGIAGWFYLRNWMHYGDPFLGNWDSASGFHYEQLPGYRTAGFYLRFGALLWHLPEWSRWSGFWEGLYGTLWADAQGFVVPHESARGQVAGSLLLWLGLLPTLAIVTGFFRATRRLFSAWDQPLFLLVTTSCWTLWAIALFTLEVPFFSTVCAFFALSLLPAIAVFAGLGFETLVRRLGRLRFVLYADVLALALVSLYMFGLR